ncbi:MAG: hypothetical protein KDA24_28490 [Deltaproteobacteria bacterium]|nr:hypothetical protein [Deltaproteobacteria bacterium]
MDDLDQALAELPRYDASEWAIQEVLRQVHEDQNALEEPEEAVVTPRPRFGLWAGIAAVTMLGAGLFVLNSQDAPGAPTAATTPSGMTLKGASDSRVDPSISLGLSLLRNDVPVALVPGATALGSDTVLLRYTTDSSGFAYLFRVGPEGDLEVFHGTPTLPGTHHVTVDGRIVGYELDGLAGEHTFGVAFSEEPWAPSQGTDAADAPQSLGPALAAKGAFPRTVENVTIDVRSVRLEPSGR